MRTKSLLLSAPPYPVEQAMQRLGANLRTARLRRNLTIEQVADPSEDEEGIALDRSGRVRARGSKRLDNDF